ncbi:MAG TPA: hypothetical protein VFZ65_13355 [Planctomycetota bacterium]|nr:hypothetical protein [Planctomycetota bacterium]
MAPACDSAADDGRPTEPVVALTPARVVERRVCSEPASELEQLSAVTLPLENAQPGPGLQLVVPSKQQLQAVLARANTVDELVEFDRLMSILRAAGERFRIALEEAIDIAAQQLIGKRKLGQMLLQHVKRGGDRSKSHDATLLDGRLPAHFDKHRASRYEALARIDASHFRDCLREMADLGQIPTEAGMLRRAAKLSGTKLSKPRGAGRKRFETTKGGRAHRWHAIELPGTVLETLRRIMAVDVRVGDADMRAKRVVPHAANDLFDRLSGDVFVAACPDPARWLPELRRLRNKARIQQVIVVVAAEVWSEWFAVAQADGWTACFLRDFRCRCGLGVMLLHHGAKASGFRVATTAIGTVMN